MLLISCVSNREHAFRLVANCEALDHAPLENASACEALLALAVQ